MKAFYFGITNILVFLLDCICAIQIIQIVFVLVFLINTNSRLRNIAASLGEGKYAHIYELSAIIQISSNA